MCRNMVEQLMMYAIGNKATGFTKLKVEKYREMRDLHPQLPSHYVCTACQDASTRAKSFLKLKKRGLTDKVYTVVRNISILLDGHLWKLNGLTSIEIATHKGRLSIGFVPHERYWKYFNRCWGLASEVKIKLDNENRQLLVYLTFVKEIEEYKHEGYLL